MTAKRNYKYLLFLLLGFVFALTACNPPIPTPQPTTYNPGCSVQNLIGHINQANSNAGSDVINLDPNCVYTLTHVDNSASVDGITIHNGLPVITSEITIQGNNAIIEIQKDPGEPFFGHFFVDASGDLELYDLLISDGSRYLGGAVVNQGGDFFASNVVFVDNLAYPADGDTIARGGAIFSDSGWVRVIDGCLFQGNKAGESIFSGANLGGAIYSKDSSLLVSNSSFLFNQAAGDGGAIYAEKTPSNEGGGLITISDSEFNENSAHQNGGAVALINEIEGVLIVTTWFRQHTAANYGGAIYAEGTDLVGNHLEFRLNDAEYGGAVYTKRPGEGILSIFNDDSSLYIDNTAAEVGGAIFSENSDLEIENSDFENNAANSCGAIRNGGSPSLDVGADDLETALRITSDARITDSSFRYNYALVSHGGGICHVMGEMLVQGTTIFGNHAFDSGGGMIVHDQAEIIGSHFAINNAWNGGALLIGYPILDRLEPNTYENYTWPEYMTFHTAISTSIFAANEANQSGGGIYAHHDGTTSIKKSLFQNNTALTGGGILRYDGKMFINNSTFSANSASRGGGIRAYDQVGSRLGIKHTTFAFNTATETSNGGNVYNVSWGGGALNAGYHVTVENSLFAGNTPMDCQLTNGSNYSASETYDSDGTCSVLTEPNPQIGPLLNPGGGTKTHALLPGSPLIDILPDCAGMTEDQRGLARPQGSACDPGAYEFDPNDPPSPPPPPPVPDDPPDDPPDDSSTNCAPFENMDISVFLLNVPADTLVLPLYFRFPGDVPGHPTEYRALLGEIESNNCGLQGFPDRLYCMFSLPPEAPGLALDLKLFIGDCVDPAYSQSKVTIPRPKCHADLGETTCEVAGGTWKRPVTGGDYYCDCP